MASRPVGAVGQSTSVDKQRKASLNVFNAFQTWRAKDHFERTEEELAGCESMEPLLLMRNTDQQAHAVQVLTSRQLWEDFAEYIVYVHKIAKGGVNAGHFLKSNVMVEYMRTCLRAAKSVFNFVYVPSPV